MKMWRSPISTITAASGAIDMEDLEIGAHHASLKLTHAIAMLGESRTSLGETNAGIASDLTACGYDVAQVSRAREVKELLLAANEDVIALVLLRWCASSDASTIAEFHDLLLYLKEQRDVACCIIGSWTDIDSTLSILKSGVSVEFIDERDCSKGSLHCRCSIAINRTKALASLALKASAKSQTSTAGVSSASSAASVIGVASSRVPPKHTRKLSSLAGGGCPLPTGMPGLASPAPALASPAGAVLGVSNVSNVSPFQSGGGTGSGVMFESEKDPESSAKFAVMQRLQAEVDSMKIKVQQLVWEELRACKYPNIPPMISDPAAEAKDFPYSIDARIGDGTYGVVSKGKCRETGRVVAIKKLTKQKVTDMAGVGRIENEITHLRTLRHPHILELINVLHTKSYIHIITDFEQGGPLTGYITHQDPLIPDSYIKAKLRQIISAIAFLHEHRVAHRDIKGDNILVSDTGDMKLADFGFATALPPGKEIVDSEWVGTKGYCAPEILVKGPYNPFMSDMWSVGIVLAEMTTSMLGYFQEMPKLRVDIEFKIDCVMKAEVMSRRCEKLVDLLRCLLKFKPEERLTAAGALAHPFLSGDCCMEHYEMPIRADSRKRRMSLGHARRPSSAIPSPAANTTPVNSSPPCVTSVTSVSVVTAMATLTESSSGTASPEVGLQLSGSAVSLASPPAAKNVTVARTSSLYRLSPSSAAALGPSTPRSLQRMGSSGGLTTPKTLKTRFSFEEEKNETGTVGGSTSSSAASSPDSVKSRPVIIARRKVSGERERR